MGVGPDRTQFRLAGVSSTYLSLGLGWGGGQCLQPGGPEEPEYSFQMAEMAGFPAVEAPELNP